jgi:hypothetical protein
MRRILSASFCILAFILFISCSKSGNNSTIDNNVNCETVPKNFTNNINPIIQTFCNQPNCHNNTSTNGPGPLTNYTEVFNARSSIRAAVNSGLMPQNTTLSTAQKNAIICWIDAGAANN